MPPARRVQPLHYLWVYVKCLVYLSECPSAATGNCRSKVWSTRTSIRGFIKRELLIFTLTVCRSDFVHVSRKMGPWHNEMRIGSPHTGKNTIHTIQYWSNDLDTQLAKSIQLVWFLLRKEGRKHLKHLSRFIRPIWHSNSRFFPGPSLIIALPCLSLKHPLFIRRVNRVLRSYCLSPSCLW